VNASDEDARELLDEAIDLLCGQATLAR